MNNDNPLKRIKFVCFEGADMCGKTTSAIEFCKRVPLAIYVHFPRRELIDVDIPKDVQLELFEHNLEPKDEYNAQRFSVQNRFKDMGTTIFNDEWWKEQSFLDLSYGGLFENVMNNITQNIEVSANDKEIFLKNLIDIFKKGKYEFKDLPFTKDWRFFKNGEEVKDFDLKIKVFNQFIKSIIADDATADKQYFVLDRFLLSGNIYNLMLPIRKAKEELLKKAIEENIDIDNVYKNIVSMENYHKGLQGSRNRGILELLTEDQNTCNLGFEIPLNFLTVLCTPPETDLSRPEKQDEYDKSTWLSKNVKDLMYGCQDKALGLHQKHMRYAWWFKGNYAGNRYCTKEEKYDTVLVGPNYRHQVPMIYSTVIAGKSTIIGNHPIYRWYVDPSVWEEDPYLYPLPTLFHWFKDLKDDSDEWEVNKSFSIKGSEVTQGSDDEISKNNNLERENYYEWLKCDICNYF